MTTDEKLQKALFKYYLYTSNECLNNNYTYLAILYYEKAASVYEGWPITITGEVL